MEVERVEIRDLLQAFPVNDFGAGALAFDQAVLAERLKNAVHVYGGEAGRIAKLWLRERQDHLSVAREIQRLHARIEFTEDMRDALVGIATAKIGDPFAEDRRINERVAIQDVRNAWARGR